MAEINAALVAKLRAMTNVGMMHCKQALIEANGDLEAAVDVLRKKGIATAANKAAREAREGVIAQHILPGAKVGVLVEVNCETDFVAKNESFRAFSDEVARLLATDPNADLEAQRVNQVAQIGENIKISRRHRIEVAGIGMVAAYIHTGAKVGVLVEVGAGRDETIGRDSFKQFVRDVTLQVAAAAPAAVTRDQIPTETVAKEREIAAEQVKNKPPQAIARIVEGKLDKYFQTVCLVEQGFLKRNSEVTVKEHLAALARELDDDIQIRQFVRFQVGEAPSA
jgi:elongation factor Ts